MPLAPITPDELASILRSVEDGITAQGPDGALLYANDAAARLCGLASAEEMLSLSGAELLERFEIVGEDGEPLPLEQLPNRRVIAEREPQDGVLGYRLLPAGDVRWSVVRSTPILTESGELRLVITVFHDITAGASRPGAAALPRRGEHAAVVVARLRGHARRPRAPARAARRRLLHRRRARVRQHAAAPGRHLPPRPEARGAAAGAAPPLPARDERGAPRQRRAAERGAAPDRGRPRGRARARRRRRRSISPSTTRSRPSRTSSSRSRRAGGCWERSRSAPANRAAASTRTISSWRTRSPGGQRSRSTTRSSFERRRSRMRSSTRCSSRPRSGSASGTTTSASSASTTRSPS